MLSVKIEANTILSRFVLEEMDKTLSSIIRSNANVVETKVKCAHTLTLSDLCFLKSLDVVSKDWSKYNSKQILSEEIDKTLSSNMRNDLNVAETKAESAKLLNYQTCVFLVV